MDVSRQGERAYTSNLQLIQIIHGPVHVLAHQHLPRLGAVRGAHDAVLLHHLDHAGRAVVAHPEPALDERRGRLAVHLHKFHGAFVLRVALDVLILRDLGLDDLFCPLLEEVVVRFALLLHEIDDPLDLGLAGNLGGNLGEGNLGDVVSNCALL